MTRELKEIILSIEDQVPKWVKWFPNEMSEVEIPRHDLLLLVKMAKIAMVLLHRRRCHDCGETGYYKDNVTPYVNCWNCGSQDTRRITNDS